MPMETYSVWITMVITPVKWSGRSISPKEVIMAGVLIGNG